MSRGSFHAEGVVERHNRFSRSRSVEDVPQPGFNVFGKGLFEADDCETDGATYSPLSDGKQWSKSRELQNHNNEFRAEKPHAVAPGRFSIDRRQSMVRADLHRSRRSEANIHSAEKDRKQIELSEVQEMKEKFAKLLLGEDLSGGKKGVSSALALSNAITNLSGSIVGELWRLEPLAPERKAMWRKEMDWFLSVVDHIVEFVPSYQSSGDGPPIEVMTMKPRSDLQINIPALRKLEAMLFDCMEGFVDTEFWYADKAISESEKSILSDVPRQKDKWWLPVPRVPPGGLSSETRKDLQSRRESVNQILKAAMAINSQVLSEMEIPDLYWDSFPKNGREILGDVIYRHITSDNFCPEVLMAALDLTSDHSILDSKNRIEAAVAIWRRKILSKDAKRSSKPPWGGNNDEKRELQAERAETVLTLLRLRFPGLPQTVLDMSKIQHNKDVGQAVLESYSRVLESLASNILSRIEDVLYADDMAKRERFSASFTRSLSCSDSHMTSLFEDHSNNSFTTLSPSPLPCIFPAPLGRGQPQSRYDLPPMNGSNHIIISTAATPHPVSPAAPPPSLERSRSSRTLSEFIGSQISPPTSSSNGIDSRFSQELDQYAHGGFKHFNEDLAHDPLVRPYNQIQKRHYWTYIDGLEKVGALCSPPSRH